MRNWHAGARRPNILILMSDQHGRWASEPYGHHFIQTPHLCSLAERGTVFDNAYCNSPVCGPSRASLLTGLYLKRHEVYEHLIPMRSDLPTLAHYLAGAGYQTVLIGKQHFVGPDQTHGFELRLGEELHSTRISPSMYDPFGPPTDRSAFYQVRAGRTRYLDYDYRVERDAARFLQGEGRDPNRPFALVVSMITPHFPLVVEQKYLDLYWPAHGDVPPVPEGYVERLHPAWQALRRFFQTERLDHDIESTRKARAAYYALCTFMDHRMGGVLNALREAGLESNTLVVYTSDHGEHAGTHGIWWKSTFFEESAGVPLIVKWPGHVPEGQRRPQVVSLVDVAATVLAAAGVEDRSDLDGQSFLPLLNGSSPTWENMAFAEYYGSGAEQARCMLRVGPYKLNWFHGLAPELYDLERDPGEWTNVADDPEYAPVLAEMRDRIDSMWDGEAIWNRVLEGRKRRRIILLGERTYLGPLRTPGS